MFTKQELIQKYKDLSQSQSKQERDEANQYLMKLQASDQCWQIAQEIILDPPNIEIQFIACQLIYRKTKEAFQKLSSQQQAELKQFLITVFFKLKGPALLQICSSLALIMIYDSKLWYSCLDELISLMQNENMEVGLEIMQQIAVETREMTQKKNQMQVQEAFIQQKDKIYEIFRSLLLLEKVSAIKCLDAWVEFGLQILEQEQLIRAILELAIKNPEAFKNGCNVLTNCIKYSSSKNLHRSENPLAKCASMINQNEVNSLNLIFTFLVKVNPQQEVRAFVELLTRFSTDFILFVINDPNEILQKIFIMTSHGSRKVSYITFEFWIEFRQVLHKRQSEISTAMMCYEYLLRILQPVIDHCRLKTLRMKMNQQNKENYSDDDEEPDDKSQSYCVNAFHYREFSKEVFFTIFEAAKDINQQSSFFSILKQNMLLGYSENTDFIYQITQTEAALFATQSVLDDYILDLNNQDFYFIIDYILTVQSKVEQQQQGQLTEGWMDIIVKTSLQLFYAFTQQLNITSELFERIIQYFLKHMLHTTIGPIAAQYIQSFIFFKRALEAISTTIQIIEKSNIIDDLINYFINSWKNFVNYGQTENYLCSILGLCIKLQNQNQGSQLIQKILQYIQSQFQDFLQIQDSKIEKFESILNLILSPLNWFSLNIESIQTNEIQQLPLEMSKFITNPLIQIISKQSFNVPEDLINKELKFFKILIKVSNQNSQNQELEAILNLAISMVSSDPFQYFKLNQRSNWLEIISLSVQKSDKNEVLNRWLSRNIQNLNKFCLDKFYSSQDPDLLKNYISVLRQIAAKDVNLILYIEDLMKIIQTIQLAIQQIPSYEMQREVLFFLKDIMFYSSQDSVFYVNLLPSILSVIYANFHLLSAASMNQISQITIVIVHKCQNKIELYKCISQNLAQGWGKGKKQIQIDLVSKAIVCHSLSNAIGQPNRDLKILLSNLRSQDDCDINYMALELFVKKTKLG